LGILGPEKKYFSRDSEELKAGTKIDQHYYSLYERKTKKTKKIFRTIIQRSVLWFAAFVCVQHGCEVMAFKTNDSNRLIQSKN
jgi:hypothetical protein